MAVSRGAAVVGGWRLANVIALDQAARSGQHGRCGSGRRWAPGSAPRLSARRNTGRRSRRPGAYELVAEPGAHRRPSFSCGAADPMAAALFQREPRQARRGGLHRPRRGGAIIDVEKCVRGFGGQRRPRCRAATNRFRATFSLRFGQRHSLLAGEKTRPVGSGVPSAPTVNPVRQRGPASQANRSRRGRAPFLFAALCGTVADPMGQP